MQRVAETTAVASKALERLGRLGARVDLLEARYQNHGQADE